MGMIKPFLAAAAAIAFAAVGAADAQTLKSVQDRGKLVCGVSQGLAGFSIKDDKGEWTGFDVDFCRALAAAIFNDPSKVEFVPLSASERFDALKDKKIDVLSRNSTWTLGREEDFEPRLRRASPITTARRSWCPRAATPPRRSSSTAARSASRRARPPSRTPRTFSRPTTSTTRSSRATRVADIVANYLAGKCNVLTTDESQLFALRSQFPKPGDHMILPDVISKEPLGPVVRQDDIQWFNIVKWVNYALLDAEEIGVSSKTIDDALKSQKPAVKRLVGTEGDFGKPLGLTNAWAANAIRAVGNYGEIFDRNVGAHTKLGIPRGLNELWDNGGIQYAPPIR